MTRGLIAGLVLLCGCGSPDVADPPAEGDWARGGASVGGRVISTVDGHPITVADVQAAARAAGVSPRVALQRLQDEELLAAAAARAGIGETEGRRAARQAAVQRLLAEEVEAAVGPDAVDPAAIEAAFEESLERFERPERRSSVHLLARIPEDAPPGAEAEAEAWIAARHREIAEAPDAEAAVLAYQTRPPGDRTFEVLAESVPALPRDGAADPAYLRALFSPEAEGLVDAPVRTSFGWHVVVVTEIEPRWEATREEALETLREERLASLRHARLTALLQRLAAESEIEVDPEAARAALSNPALAGEAP